LLHLCLWNIKKFCKALVDAPIRFFNSSKQTENEEDRGLELERGQMLLKKKLKQTITQSSSCVPFLISDVQRTFVTFQFVHPLTQKSFNLIKE
jgi:hypothetical protein